MLLDYVPLMIVTSISIGSAIIMILLFRKFGWMNNITK
jgi:hypothetical protein